MFSSELGTECIVSNETFASLFIDAGERSWAKQSFQKVVSNTMSYTSEHVTSYSVRTWLLVCGIPVLGLHSVIFKVFQRF